MIHPLLALLPSLPRQDLAQQVTYLKAENRILRSTLPDRITLSNQERRILLRHGKKPGGKIKQVMSIVSYSTFRRWLRKIEDESPAATVLAATVLAAATGVKWPYRSGYN